MSKTTPTGLLVFSATLLMALATSTASARNFSLSNQNIRITFNILEFAAEGLPSDSCHVTLEGSFHSRTFAKTPETLIGFMTRITTGGCSVGTTILTATLPWHVRYTGFSGALPNIASIIAKIIGASYNIGALGFNCLAGANMQLNSTREAGGGISGIEVPVQEIAVRGGGGFGCPASTGTFRSVGAGSATLLGTTTRITVTLI